MSNYVPPAGDAIVLDVKAPTYTPPAGDAIEIDVRSEDDIGAYRNSAMLFLFLG